jgi:hypothetical protein
MADEKRGLTFSERRGIKPIRTVFQVDSMDDALRNSLWNILTYWYFDSYREHYRVRSDSVLGRLVIALWRDFLKLKIDDLPTNCLDVVEKIRKYFDNCPWNEVYDLVEFVAGRVDEEHFCRHCNQVLKRELSAYRFTGKKLGPIMSEEETASIETALALSDRYRPVSTHLKSALEKFADRQRPDYRNSIKESISAVEAMCKIITGDEKATLGQAVKKLEESGVNVHPAFRDALSKMYGYTNDADGIRHGLLNESKLDADDARFMLVSCSAFVNYLKAKSSKGD